MAFLIFGCGFIGLPLCKTLAASVSDDIYIISRSKISVPLPANVKFIVGDAYDPFTFVHILPMVHCIYYLLPSGSPVDNVSNPISMISCFRQLIFYCKKFNISRFIFASSVSVYGDCSITNPSDESFPKNPISLHAEIKTIQEKILLSNSSSSFLPIICRVSNPYGINQRFNLLQGIIGIMLNSFLSSSSLTLRDKGSHTRDFIYIDDVVNSMASIFRILPSNVNVVNICSGSSFSILHVYKLLSDCFGYSLNVVDSGSSDREVKNSFISNSLLQKCAPDLVKSFTPLEKGISTLCSNLN